jgi:uncharacterized protein YndB with AHSA1/START domain
MSSTENRNRTGRASILAAVLSLLGVGVGAHAQQVDPLEFRRHLRVSTQEVWKAWTTVEGAREFFSRDAIIEGRVDGEYSILFFPENPPGARGAEGMRILAFEPDAKRLVFTWNAPRNLPYARGQRTVVEVVMQEAPEGGTDLKLHHYGWGQAEDWPGARDYFEGAWEVVLNRLVYRFEHGPIDWSRVSEIEGLYYSG